MISDEAAAEMLRLAWGLGDGTRVVRHDGGMGSQTWIVDRGGCRWVAKSVAPQLADSFALGLQVARLLEQAGISAGAPVPALSGAVTVDAASGDRPAAAHLGLRPWVRPAVGAAVDALAALQRRDPPWPQGLLHADPAPEAFRHDAATGRCGIIDWSSAHHGPLLYDLTGIAGPEENEKGLDDARRGRATGLGDHRPSTRSVR